MNSEEASEEMHLWNHIVKFIIFAVKYCGFDIQH